MGRLNNVGLTHNDLPLTTGEFAQGLLPSVTKGDTELKAVEDCLTLGGNQLSLCARQE